MVIAVIVIALLAMALCVVVLLYRRELMRWVKFMRNRPPASNARLGTEAPLPGSRDVVGCINALLDEASLHERTLKEQDRELLEGLAGLSHDIRTPLAGAKGYVQLAIGEEDSAERVHCLKLAESRLDVTREMVDQLFDYMRLTTESDALDVECCNVTEILASILADLYHAFEDKGWECQVDLNEELDSMVDPVALRRVFENILGNMLKHGSGDIRIKRFENTLDFSNAIEAESEIDESRVFERFYRGDSARGKTGAGLGLAAVKQLCELMGIAVRAIVSDDVFSISLVFNLAECSRYRKS